MITQARLKELLSYDPDTGVFVWRIKSSKFSYIEPGSVAGWEDNGYIKISLDGRDYKAHRLAWLYVYGAWPSKFVDHKNQVRADNRIRNLRDASREINGQNQTKAHAQNRSCGLLGVSRSSWSKKWIARLKVDGKRLYLGTFATPELAHAAYVATKRELHPGFVS